MRTLIIRGSKLKTLARPSGPNITAVEGGGAVTVTFAFDDPSGIARTRSTTSNSRVCEKSP